MAKYVKTEEGYKSASEFIGTNSLNNETFINVKDFGAKGDGIADDKVALIKAFDYAIANLPATVYLPKGEYTLYRGGI